MASCYRAWVHALACVYIWKCGGCAQRVCVKQGKYGYHAKEWVNADENTELQGYERALDCCRRVTQQDTRSHFYGKNEAGLMVEESALLVDANHVHPSPRLRPTPNGTTVNDFTSLTLFP
jgi:hypothetical protein